MYRRIIMSKKKWLRETLPLLISLCLFFLTCHFLEVVQISFSFSCFPFYYYYWSFCSFIKFTSGTQKEKVNKQVLYSLPHILIDGIQVELVDVLGVLSRFWFLLVIPKCLLDSASVSTLLQSSRPGQLLVYFFQLSNTWGWQLCDDVLLLSYWFK